MGRKKKDSLSGDTPGVSTGAEHPPPAAPAPEQQPVTAPAPALSPAPPPAAPAPPAPPAPAAEIAEREQTPWANFNEPPANPAMDTEAIRKAIKEKEAADAALVGAPGFHWHEAMRDSGSGKYRKGKRYMLPNGQSPARFKRLG